MSEKKRQKKDGEEKNKSNRQMREVESKGEKQNTPDRRRGIEESGINRQ